MSLTVVITHVCFVYAGLHSQELLPLPPQLLQLPQILLHICQWSHLPWHPRPKTITRRRHSQRYAHCTLPGSPDFMYLFSAFLTCFPNKCTENRVFLFLSRLDAGKCFIYESEVKKKKNSPLWQMVVPASWNGVSGSLANLSLFFFLMNISAKAKSSIHRSSRSVWWSARHQLVSRWDKLFHKPLAVGICLSVPCCYILPPPHTHTHNSASRMGRCLPNGVFLCVRHNRI